MTKLSDLEAKRERLIAKSKGAKNILDNIIRGISELDGQIEEAKAEPVFSFGDRVIAWSKNGEKVKGIFNFKRETEYKYNVIDGDPERAGMYEHCILDPDQRTLEFVAHDYKSEFPVDGETEVCVIDEGEIICDYARAITWHCVKYYAIKPKWMK